MPWRTGLRFARQTSFAGSMVDEAENRAAQFSVFRWGFTDGDWVRFFVCVFSEIEGLRRTAADIGSSVSALLLISLFTATNHNSVVEKENGTVSF